MRYTIPASLHHDKMSSPTSSATQLQPTSATRIPLPKADAENISLCEEGLYDDFWLNSFRRPYFKFPSASQPEAFLDELPLLHFNWPGGNPDSVYSLSTRVPPHLLERFTNTDTVLYVRPGAIGDIARDLFKAWYPHRPLLPTHIPAGPAHNYDNLPTDADAYAHVQQAFCVAMDYVAADDGPEGFTLAELIRCHIALVHLIEAEMDDIAMPQRNDDKHRSLIGLGGGFGDGFCIHEGPGVIGDYRYPYEKRDTRASRELRVVGRESWIRWGWDIDNIVDSQSWVEVEGVRDEAANEKWWTCTMPLQDAVDGVIRASGEEGRFDEKPVSEYFRDEFLEPEQLSEKEIEDLLKLNEDFRESLTRAVRAKCPGCEICRAEASNEPTQTSDQTPQ